MLNVWESNLSYNIFFEIDTEGFHCVCQYIAQPSSLCYVCILQALQFLQLLYAAYKYEVVKIVFSLVCT